MPGSATVLGVDALGDLVSTLRRQGWRVMGPTVRDGAIVIAELTSADDLPFGWGVQTDAGRYRLVRREDCAAFAHSAGPQSWKSVLHPARARLWAADRGADGAVTATGVPDEEVPRYALLGVRPCDLRAIGLLDTVLAGGRHRDPVYTSRREGIFVVVAECTEPGQTCFCVSMGGGPAAEGGYDLALTELLEPEHLFVVRAGTPAGAEVLAALAGQEAQPQTVRAAQDAVAAAASRMGRAMPAVDLRDLLVERRGSPHWADVAARCLTCGNCTMVCPTCFCTTTQDVTDLTYAKDSASGPLDGPPDRTQGREHAERWRVWDSCFSLDFTYMHGGEVRTTGESRYRQWISHKLSTWYDQFGSSGCVGCGRCIAWCPAGIDITAEASALAAERPEVTA